MNDTKQNDTTHGCAGCNALSIDVKGFNEKHNKMSQELEALKQRAKNSPGAKDKLELITNLFAEMNLAKSGHDKEIKEHNTKDATVENIASAYEQSIADICAALKDEGELSGLVVCSARFQLKILLCEDDACKQGELLMIVQELSLLVKDCDSLTKLLTTERETFNTEKCKPNDQCAKYLRDDVACETLKIVMKNLQAYEDLDFTCIKLEELCPPADCKTEEDLLAEAYADVQKIQKDYSCSKEGCTSASVGILQTKSQLERLFQTIKGLSGQAKQQLAKTKSYLDAMNNAIKVKNTSGAVLQYCYFIASRDVLCGELSFNTTVLENDFYEITDIVSSFGACCCTDGKSKEAIEIIWCEYKNSTIEELNKLYKKELDMFEKKEAWVCASTEHNKCLSDLEENAINTLEEEIKSYSGESDDSCKSKKDTTETKEEAK